MACPIQVRLDSFVVACILPDDHEGRCIGRGLDGKVYYITVFEIPKEFRLQVMKAQS